MFLKERGLGRALIIELPFVQGAEGGVSVTVGRNFAVRRLTLTEVTLNDARGEAPEAVQAVVAGFRRGLGGVQNALLIQLVQQESARGIDRSFMRPGFVADEGARVNARNQTVIIRFRGLRVYPETGREYSVTVSGFAELFVERASIAPGRSNDR
jgi:hypothetical protein